MVQRSTHRYPPRYVAIILSRHHLVALRTGARGNMLALWYGDNAVRSVLRESTRSSTAIGTAVWPAFRKERA